MIDEVVEVKNYIAGKNIDKKILYRICYLLAKWYKEQGLSRLEIRKSIFDWGKENGIYIGYNLNNIINRVSKDKRRLTDNISIRINNNDIDEIKSRFDSKNTRLTALAILCYAKAYADRDKSFSISSITLSNWLGIESNNLRGRHIQELIDYEYISKSSTPVQRYGWDNDGGTCRYTIHVDLHNSGKYILTDNDIRGLYFEIF